AVVGFVATALWVPLLGFLGGPATVKRKTVFGKDVSFYLLALPWYDAVVSAVITVLVATMALWAVTGLGFYPSSGRPWHHPAYSLRWGSTRSPRVIDTVDADSWAIGEMIWEKWLRQGLVLAMLLCFASAASRFLGRYHLI